MSDFITFGGVKLEKNQVAKTSKRTLSNEYGKSETYYIVEFKNGQKAAYTESKNGSISASNDPAFAKTNIYGVMGLELIGTKNNMDEINITNSNIKYVDVSGDGGGDSVKVTNSTVHASMKDYDFVGNALSNLGVHGEIITDKNDNTEIKHAFETEYTREGQMFIHDAKRWGVHRFDRSK